ncbi:MAG: hypothetical protein PVI70_06435 [Gammaproteobacteria bacterium]
MPFTPLHMGPGLLLKACLQGAFSLMVFGWSQILIDIQPLVVMLTGSGTLHGWSHTYAGATLIAVAAALSGKYLGELGLRYMKMSNYIPIIWRTAAASAFIGTWSHVFVDGIMHADMAPLAPLSETRLLYGIIGVDTLHILCLTSAVLGAAGYLGVRRWRRL